MPFTDRPGIVVNMGVCGPFIDRPDMLQDSHTYYISVAEWLARPSSDMKV